MDMFLAACVPVLAYLCQYIVSFRTLVAVSDVVRSLVRSIDRSIVRSFIHSAILVCTFTLFVYFV